MTNSIIDRLDFLIDEDTNTDTDDFIAKLNSLISSPSIAAKAKEVGVELDKTLYALYYDLDSVEDEIEELDEEFDVCLEDGLPSDSYPMLPLFMKDVVANDFCFGNLHFGTFKGVPVIAAESGMGGLALYTNATELPE